MAWSMRGIISSTMCLSSLLDTVECDIVAISEHKLKCESASYLNSIHKDFFSFVKIDQSRNVQYPVISNFVGKGGVAFLIKKSLQFCVKEITGIESNRIIAVTILLYIYLGFICPLTIVLMIIEWNGILLKVCTLIIAAMVECL